MKWLLFGALCALANLASAAPRVVFEDGFESGFGSWDAWRSAHGGWRAQRAQVVPAPPDQRGMSGMVLHVPYDIDAPQPRGIAYRADSNRGVQLAMQHERLEHFSVAGCFSLADRPGDVQTAQRKLLYLWGFPQRQRTGGGGWTLVLSAWGGVPTTSGVSPIRLELATGPYAVNSGGAGKLEYAANLQYNQRYCLDLRARLNTVGQADGYVELRLDGVRVMYRDRLSFRRNADPLGNVRIGAQINDGSHIPDGRGPRHESRYWDDIRITDLREAP